MKKVLILGSGGAGKTTFAIKLAEKIQQPLYHLDALYWKPNRQKPSEEEWEQTVLDLLSQNTWIIDGSYLNTLSLRVPKADTILFLDIPNYQCVWNIIKRRIRYAKWTGKTRPGLAAHTSERIYFSFLKWVWHYRKKEKPKVLAIIEKHKAAHTTVHTFTNYAAAQNFLNSL